MVDFWLPVGASHVLAHRTTSLDTCHAYTPCHRTPRTCVCGATLATIAATVVVSPPRRWAKCAHRHELGHLPASSAA